MTVVIKGNEHPEENKYWLKSKGGARKMTEQELVEKIQRVLLQYMSAIHAELVHSHDDVFLAKKTLALIKQAGYKSPEEVKDYVRLSEDQSLPENPFPQWRTYDDEIKSINYSQAQEDMLRGDTSGVWRKVKDPVTVAQ